MPDYRRTREENPLLYDQPMEVNTERSPKELLVYREDDPLSKVPSKDGSMDWIHSFGNPVGSPQAMDMGVARGMTPTSTESTTTFNNPFAGLGDALGRGLSAITPSQETLMNGLNRLSAGLEAGGATLQGRTPLYVQLHQAARDNAFKQQQLDMQQDELGMKRMQMAQTLQQQKLQAQQKMDENVLGIWKDHQMPMAMKKKITQQFAQQGSALAANLNRLGDEHLVAEMDTLAPFLPQGKQQELAQMMTQPNADLDQVEQWVNFARDKKKVAGEQRMKSERFSELLKQHNDGSLDPMSPEADEFDNLLSEREARQAKAAETKMRIQQLGLGNQEKSLDLAAKSAMNEYGPEIHTENGQVKRQEFNRQSGQVRDIIGNKPPLVQMVNKQETAEAAEVGKDLGKQFNTMQASAISAQNRITKLARMEQLLEGVKTGALIPTMTQLENIAQTFGLQVNKKLGAKQAFTALAGEVALTLRNTGEGNGMPGQLSDKDREFLIAMTPNLAQTPEGNKLIIETAKKLSQREIEVAKLAREYRKKHGSLDPGFYEEAQAYADKNPLFKQAAKAQSTSQSGPYSDPAKEQRYQEWKRRQGK